MTRPGRPRRMDRRPKKKTSLPPPEVLMKRAAIAQGGDEVLASTPLGYSRARQLIGRDAYYAGLRFAALYRRFAHKHIHPKAALLDGDKQGPPPVDEKAEKRHETAYRQAKQALQGAGSRACRAVESITVFEHWPGIGEAQDREIIALQDGLNTLARHFGTTTEQT